MSDFGDFYFFVDDRNFDFCEHFSGNCNNVAKANPLTFPSHVQKLIQLFEENISDLIYSNVYEINGVTVDFFLAQAALLPIKCFLRFDMNNEIYSNMIKSIYDYEKFTDAIYQLQTAYVELTGNEIGESDAADRYQVIVNDDCNTIEWLGCLSEDPLSHLAKAFCEESYVLWPNSNRL